MAKGAQKVEIVYTSKRPKRPKPPKPPKLKLDEIVTDYEILDNETKKQLEAFAKKSMKDMDAELTNPEADNREAKVEIAAVKNAAIKAAKKAAEPAKKPAKRKKPKIQPYAGEDWEGEQNDEDEEPAKQPAEPAKKPAKENSKFDIDGLLDDLKKKDKEREGKQMNKVPKKTGKKSAEPAKKAAKKAATQKNVSSKENKPSKKMPASKSEKSVKKRRTEAQKQQAKETREKNLAFTKSHSTDKKLYNEIHAKMIDMGDDDKQKKLLKAKIRREVRKILKNPENVTCKEKRAPSAYNKFFKKFYKKEQTYQDDTPNFTIPELAKKAGEKWRGFSDEKKMAYMTAAQQKKYIEKRRKETDDVD